MELYIHASSAISPQTSAIINSMVPLPDEHAHFAVEPGYSDFFTPAMSRRMSRVIKMGVASGLQCLQNAGIQTPDAIITATGYGCFEDSLKFLESLIQNKETILSPTPFIQSTHNTIGAQIALLRTCYGYNNTHVHGGFSFENALVDCVLYLDKHPSDNILLGAADELTQVYLTLKSRENETNSATNTPLNLGEGAAFFLVNTQPKDALGVIKMVKTGYKPNKDNLVKLIESSFDSVPDIVLCGDYTIQDDPWNFASLIHTIFKDSDHILFKKMCGNYQTSSAFATWMSLQLFKERPELKNILIANRFDEDQFSFINIGNA